MSRYRIHLPIVLMLDVVSALSARFAFESGHWFFLMVSIVSLSLAGYFFICLMQDEVGIIVNATWVALGAMNVTLASYLVYGESITWLQGLAMVLIVLGLIFVEYFSPKNSADTLFVDDLKH